MVESDVFILETKVDRSPSQVEVAGSKKMPGLISEPSDLKAPRREGEIIEDEAAP